MRRIGLPLTETACDAAQAGGLREGVLRESELRAKEPPYDANNPRPRGREKIAEKEDLTDAFAGRPRRSSADRRNQLPKPRGASAFRAPRDIWWHIRSRRHATSRSIQ